MRTQVRNAVGLGAIGFGMYVSETHLRAADSCEYWRDICAPEFYSYSQCENHNGTIWSLMGCYDDEPFWCYWEGATSCS